MGLELAKLWVRVRADDSGMQKDLQHTHKMVESAGISMSSLLRGAMAGAGALGAGLVMKHGLELASNLEQTTVAFETMLGSASAARKMLADLQQFAASTPFQLTGIQDATKVLLAFGVTQEEIMPTLKALGDISAGTGKDFKELSVIFGQIKAKGRLMGGELLQLNEAGVPIVAMLAQQFGVAESEITKMTERGKIGFKDVEKALMSMSSEGGQFNNLMEKQSQTVGGLFSTLKDNIDATLTKIFTALSPVTKAVLELAGTLVGSFSATFDSMSDGLVQWGLNTADWLKVISKNFGTVWELIKTQFAFQLSQMWDYATNFFSSIPKLAATAFNTMRIVIEGFVNYTIIDFKNMGKTFMLVLEEIQKVWMAIFTGDSVSSAVKNAMVRVNDQMISAAQQRADAIKETVLRAGLEMQAGFKDLNFTAMSEGTKILEQERNRLANILGTAKSDLEAQRLEEARRLAAEDTGGRGAKPILPGSTEQTKRDNSFVSFADFGRKLQDALFKKEDDKQQRMITLLEKGNQLQEQQINLTKNQQSVVGMLT